MNLVFITINQNNFLISIRNLNRLGGNKRRHTHAQEQSPPARVNRKAAPGKKHHMRTSLYSQPERHTDGSLLPPHGFSQLPESTPTPKMSQTRWSLQFSFSIICRFLNSEFSVFKFSNSVETVQISKLKQIVLKFSKL